MIAAAAKYAGKRRSGRLGRGKTAERRKGSKVHLAVDTLGHLLALRVTPANDQDREQVAQLMRAVQEATGETVTLAYVDQGYTGDVARQAATQHGIALAVVKLPVVKRGVRVVASPLGGRTDLGWMSRCRRLARDQERLAEVLNGFHLVAFSMLMWKRALPILTIL